MQKSVCFRYTKEIVLHHVETGNAERLIGLLLSQGSVMTLIKHGMSDAQLGLNVFKQKVNQALGEKPETWYWSSRVRYGIV